MTSRICDRLLKKNWKTYDVDEVLHGVEGIYVIGILSWVKIQQLLVLGEPKVLYVGRSNDVHRRLGEHKNQKLKIDQFVREQFEENGGENLRVKWVEEKNEDTKEKLYLDCIAHKLGYWPEYNIRR